MARLVVERSTIMSHLFSKRSCSAESDAVLVALLSIFSRYVRRMRKSKEGEEVYSWVRLAAPSPGPAPPRRGPPPPSQPPPLLQSESQDQVFLRWTGGETATMHILVVHAMVILLTLGPPRGEWPAGGRGGASSLPALFLVPLSPSPAGQGRAEVGGNTAAPAGGSGQGSPQGEDGTVSLTQSFGASPPEPPRGGRSPEPSSASD